MNQNSLEKSNKSTSIIKATTATTIFTISIAAIASWGVFTTPPGSESIFGAARFPMNHVATVAAATGEYDPYLPPEWTDTVHYEDFSNALAPLRFDSIADQANTGADPFTGTLQSVAFPGGGSSVGQCVGGEGPSGYAGNGLAYPGGLCRAQDSVVFANQASPPWVWENFLDSADTGQGDDSGGALQFEITFADGNGSGAAANLTRVYIRYSMFFEEDGVGVGTEDYLWDATSNKYGQFNTLGNGFLQLWDGNAQFFWEQISPDTDGTCGDIPEGQAMLYANTWTEYEGNEGDTIQYAFTGCSNVGRGGAGKRGIWQHHFVCMDFSPSAGSRVISWGMKSADEQGIAGYHNNVTWYYENSGVTGVTDFDSWVWNGTYGGSKVHPAQSYWFDDILVMTGTEGSCVTPPSFS